MMETALLFVLVNDVGSFDDATEQQLVSPQKTK